MQKINNLDVYTTGMQKSLNDKLFFVDKVDGIDRIVDFGCADGAFLREMYKINPDINYVGYDNNVNMLIAAQSKTDFDKYKTITYTAQLGSLDDNKYSLLNLSSVIHEVYSYSQPDEINTFWNNVLYQNYKYIAIRDFCISKSISRQSDINDYTKVIQNADKEQIDEYESIWGSLRDNRNLVHYLMKYRYTENWNREVRENYFPITLETLLSMIPTYKYEIIYFEDYILPFTKNKVKKDFDVDLHDNTHVKILLKRKD